MYTEVLLRPLAMADQRIFPTDARRLLASLLDGKNVSRLLFGRGDDGKGINTLVDGLPPLCPVVFDGGQGFIRLYGIGERGKDIVTRELGTIVQALSSHTGKAVTMELREGKVRYETGFRIYRVGKLAIAKAGMRRGDAYFALHERYQAAKSDEDRRAVFKEAAPMIRHIVDKGIAAMGNHLGIDIPKDLDIDILDGELGIRRIHDDAPGHVGVIKGLRFGMAADLIGPWSVGMLRSHGMGLVRREVPR